MQQRLLSFLSPDSAHDSSHVECCTSTCCIGRLYKDSQKEYQMRKQPLELWNRNSYRVCAESEMNALFDIVW